MGSLTADGVPAVPSVLGRFGLAALTVSATRHVDYHPGMAEQTASSGADPAATLAELERRLKQTPRASRPLEHASLRYSIGLAYAELPTGERAMNLSRAIASYRQAASLFTPERFPIEHARVQNALGAALREIGSPREAVAACAHAVELLESRPQQAMGELGAALNNLGLARSDVGEHEAAAEALGRAVEIFASAGETRQQAMASNNLGQAQAAGDDYRRAVETYERALAQTDPEDAPYQWGLLQHSLGVSLTALEESQRAAEAFGQSMRVFSRHRYPFQFALAKNNAGLAWSQLGDATSLRRAVAAYEDALRVLDVRMHREQWEQVYRNLELAESALADQGHDVSRAEHFVAMLADLDEDERMELLRERMMQIFELPESQRDQSLGELDIATLHLDYDSARRITGAWLNVLMELPNDMLVAALRARIGAQNYFEDERRKEAAEILDRTVQEELLSPQRIRVRDTLELMGYERP